MRCPFCGHDDTQVKDSRPADDNAAIRRRRSCGNCGQRFTTVERVQLRELTVAKADGRRVSFDRDKLARSIRIALRKRPVQEEQIERILNGIVRHLEASGENDIPSKQLGEAGDGGAAGWWTRWLTCGSLACIGIFVKRKDFETFLGLVG